MLRSALFLSAFFLALLWITGCNVFDGLDQEGTSDDPDLLLQDAELALARGEAEAAERYLRRALDLAPDDARVRIKLSTALLARHQIGALDLMRMARVLRGAEANAEADGEAGAEANALRLRPAAAHGAAPAQIGTVCSFDGATIENFQEFQPREIERFNLFQPSQPALEEIRTLIGRVFDTNETALGDFDGDDIQNVIDSLRSEGLTDAEIAEAAIDDAVATTTLVYLNLSEEARASYTYYYVDPDTTQTGDRYLGYCANTQPQLDEAERVAACNAPSIYYTRNLLRVRADSLLPSNSVAQEVADEAEQAYAALYEEVDPAACDTSGTSTAALRAAR